MVEVLSSIVFKNVDISVDASLEASIYIAVADDNVALLNRIFPVPGSDAVVDVSNV